MPKMKFNTRIKYKDVIHNGLEPFDVDDADVPEMQTRGGVLIVKNEPPKPSDKPDEDRKRGKKKAAGDF